jgi:hypothetical protein
MENDFLHMDTENITSYGWRPQVYNVSVPADNHRIAYGKDFTMENIVPNPLKNSKKWDGDADHGGDAGLELWVRGDHSHGYVNGSEIVSVRDDILLGSFRVGMKLSNSSGTCGAFFFVRIVILSAGPILINLVLQQFSGDRHGVSFSRVQQYRRRCEPSLTISGIGRSRKRRCWHRYLQGRTSSLPA